MQSRESLCGIQTTLGVSVTSQRRLVTLLSIIPTYLTYDLTRRLVEFLGTFSPRRGVASPGVAGTSEQGQNERQGETRVKYCCSVRYCRKVWLFRASIRNHENGSRSPAQCLTSHPQETYPASRCMASVRSPENREEIKRNFFSHCR